MESLARIAVIVTALGAVAAGLLAIARERRPGKAAAIERPDGFLQLIPYVGVGGYVLVALGTVLSGAGTLGPLAEPADAATRLAGLALMAGAGMIGLWGFVSIGRQFSTDVEVRPDSAVVTTGAFAIVRHPMYLSIILLWAGAALALLSWVIALCSLGIAAIYRERARAEEELLTRHLGEAYLAYAARVPRLSPVPRPRPGRDR